MRDTYMLNRETIRIGGLDFTLTSHSVDLTAWHVMYRKGYREANYPMPAIPLQVRYPYEGYWEMICIERFNYGKDDPVIVCCWDFYCPGSKWYGVYQPCYLDVQADWYRKNGAWEETDAT